MQSLKQLSCLRQLLDLLTRFNLNYLTSFANNFSSVNMDALALFVIDEVLEEEEEPEKKKKSKANKRKWSKVWLKNKDAFSNENLLKMLKKTEPKDYKNVMRVSDETFNDLLSRVRVFIEKQDTVMREAISAENRLGITLRFLATGNSFEDMKFSFAVSPQAISLIVIETCEAIIKVLKDFMKVPKTSEEWLDVAEQFYTKSMFPHCIGALDGKHINITRPPNSGSFYFNYKKTFSVVLMAIVNSNSNFLMVDVGANGRISDGGVFSNTNFFKKLENDELNLPEPRPVLRGHEPLPYVIVSDAAFALRVDLLKPFGHNNLTSEEIIFNKTLSSARVKVENAFGILAARFRVLYTTINLRPEKATTIVLACCYLHNYLRCQSGSNTFPGESDIISDLTSIEPTANRNASNEAKAIRRNFCETIAQLRNAQ